MKEIISDISLLPQFPDDVQTVNTRDKKLNQLMRETIVELKNIVREKNLDGLTACQIGINERIMVMKFGDDLQSFVNPVISGGKGFMLNRETCIHLPNQEFLVPRNKEITIIYETPLGAIQSARFVGKAACVAQHLIWHMDGMFIDEVGLEIDDTWDSKTDDEKAEIIKEYAEAVDQAQIELNEELNKSEDATKLKDAVEFEKALFKGEVNLKEEKVKVLDEPSPQKEDDK